MAYKKLTVTPSLSVASWKAKPTMIVLHATAGSTARSSVDHLRSIGLSYHFIIARDGKDTAKTESADGSDPIVYFCVPTGLRAAHVGSMMVMPGSDGRIANRCAIGISIANRQNGEGYTTKQLSVLDEIIQLVKKECPTVTHLTTHAVIQPWNRSDPQSVDGEAVANKHGLTWFLPSAAEVSSVKPKKSSKK